jgi:hypothetical protein
MKINYALLPATLILVLTLPVFGQHGHDDATKVDMKKHDMSIMMEKPTVDATVEGLRMKVWLMTQKEYNGMMHGEMDQMEMKDTSMGMGGDMKVMKHESMGMSKDMKGMKHDSKGMSKDMKGMKPDSMGMGKDMRIMKQETMGMGKDKKVMEPDNQGMGKYMKVRKHDSMGMNKAAMDSMMAGTHHLRLDLTDAALDKKVADANATVLIMSPSKKSSSVDLKPMMSHFDGAVTLDETGEYQFTITVNVNGVSKSTQFQYAVR